jgi:hypothetical protein
MKNKKLKKQYDFVDKYKLDTWIFVTFLIVIGIITWI